MCCSVGLGMYLEADRYTLERGTAMAWLLML